MSRSVGSEWVLSHLCRIANVRVCLVHVATDHNSVTVWLRHNRFLRRRVAASLQHAGSRERPRKHAEREAF